ncbi:collagenase NC10 and Endostatin [Ancylostoma duodenale]|uniref:Collagenase NC10 and Endostatin n=1 Tax=Ancylostoma duodenale TaxID=51022 RepID=A0A0C2GSX7_9BILA|nr:collagenase NC10 and Endostatin [Ancylostoma duodenale]
MRGMRGADLQCYREARMAGFTTTFRAMLSSNVQDMLRIVHAADWDTPVVNIRGEHLFASWRAVLNDGQRSTRPLYSFDRHHLSRPDKRIWHGSKSGGIRAGDYCDGWRSNYAALSAMAGDLRIPGGMISQAQPVSCDQKLIVLCVEVCQLLYLFVIVCLLSNIRSHLLLILCIADHNPVRLRTLMQPSRVS